MGLDHRPAEQCHAAAAQRLRHAQRIDYGYEWRCLDGSLFQTRYVGGHCRHAAKWSTPWTDALSLCVLAVRSVLDRQVVYVSEVVHNTLNPVWIPFQPDETSTEQMRHLYGGTYFDIIVIRLSDKKNNRPRRKSRALSSRMTSEDEGWQPNSRSFSDLALEDAPATFTAADDTGEGSCVREEEIMRLSLSIRELEPLPVGVAEIPNLPMNTCLFEFNGRPYVKRELLELLADTGAISGKVSRRKGSAIQLKEYSLHEGVENLEKTMHVKEQIETMTQRNQELRKDIEKRLLQVQPQVSKEHQTGILENRLKALRQKVAEKKEALQRLRTVMQDERKTFETDIHIPKALLSTMQMSMRYKDEKQGILERRSEVLRAAHKIRSRQAMLVRELGTVYPIEYVGAGDFTIRGIKISNADLTGGSSSGRVDEETISTALGYIAHLVFMLSKYLHVTLRYKVVPYSSRSYLKDEINDPNGEYPLYKKGIEKERFDRATAFLKKDVEQVRVVVGMIIRRGELT